MKIIKIDKGTIAKNPNAGSTQTIIQRPAEARFEIESNDIPKWIYKPPFFIENEAIELVTSKSRSGKIKRISGIINGPITKKQLKKWQNSSLKVNIKLNTQIIMHSPNSDYLFEYEETYLKCKHCIFECPTYEMLSLKDYKRLLRL